MFTRIPLRSARRRAAGFTLIELLVVIAIIAILSAIIFPVFATLRENSRQKTSMSNMHDIQNGLAQFKLDQGRYPQVLFGYVVPGASMDQALSVAEQQQAAAQYFPGLYPEYIKDPLTFTDPNNTVRDLSKTTASANGPLVTNTLTRVDALNYNLTPVQTSATGNFYLADAYDISPEINGSKTNSFYPSNGNPNYVVRYQTSWTAIGPSVASAYPLNYTRQLRWTNPPADTYVTCTTHHVPNCNKVIVLWESGEAKAIDASQFLTLNGSAGSDSASVTGATFWQVSPTKNSNPAP